MRTIKLTTGARLPLDGDLLTVMETLYHEMTAKRDLDRTFEDTVREIQHVIDQLTDDERRQYLSESSGYIRRDSPTRTTAIPLACSVVRFIQRLRNAGSWRARRLRACAGPPAACPAGAGAGEPARCARG